MTCVERRTFAQLHRPGQFYLLRHSDRSQAPRKAPNHVTAGMHHYNTSMVLGCWAAGCAVRRQFFELLSFARNLSLLRAPCTWATSRQVPQQRRNRTALPGAITANQSCLCPYKILAKLVFHLTKLAKFTAYKPITLLDPSKKDLRHRSCAVKETCRLKSGPAKTTR